MIDAERDLTPEVPDPVRRRMGSDNRVCRNLVEILSRLWQWTQLGENASFNVQESGRGQFIPVLPYSLVEEFCSCGEDKSWGAFTPSLAPFFGRVKIDMREQIICLYVSTRLCNKMRLW